MQLSSLESRALAAYYRVSPNADIPSAPDQFVHDGHRYVVLSNIRGLLAVYRVRNDGQLKRLRRWPAVIDEKFGR